MATDRHYQKGNPEIEPLKSAATKPEIAPLVNDGNLPALRPKYTKPEASKLPDALFVVYSGGTVREKDYFHLIDRNSALFPSVRIDFHANPNFDERGKPSIMQFAKEKTKEYKESANEENADSYFLLTDVDHFERFLPEMKQECIANNIELIISNSCFEIWLYYAERSDRCEGFAIPKNKLEISSSFKTWAGKQIKGGLKPTKAIFNIGQNIVNAKTNYVEDNGFPTLFSTQMFRMAEKMLPYVKDGLELLKEGESFKEQKGFIRRVEPDKDSHLEFVKPKEE